ncbi:MAG TPA: hypothetical protein VFZ89_05010 [Solirubrobacteraceae bacterium]
MVQAFMVLASEEESSKAAFYIAGSVLAAAGFGVSAIAIRQGGFASDQATARGVMALFAVLVIAAMATTILTA